MTLANGLIAIDGKDGLMIDLPLMDEQAGKPDLVDHTIGGCDNGP